jgi:hypothetical protein
MPAIGCQIDLLLHALFYVSLTILRGYFTYFGDSGTTLGALRGQEGLENAKCSKISI